MKLPTQLIVFYRPVLPVDIFAVVVGRLIAFMYKEGMLQSIIRPFLFFPGYGEVFQVYIRMCNTGTATVPVPPPPTSAGSMPLLLSPNPDNPNLSVQKPPALVAVHLQQQQA